jgi:biotin carboxyl carrier protein
MTVEIEINGRVRSVSVEPLGQAPGRFRVIIDGDARVFDVVRSGDERLLLMELADAGGPAATGIARARRVRDVHVSPAAASDVLITMGGRAIGATVNGRRTGRAAEAGAHAHGEQSVVAPMPGRVLRVLVSAGHDVTAKQPLVVVEAMKMENELRAPKAGRVKEVCVAPGTSVEAGKVLVVIE